jgi:diadenosine tetraphosphate (Ap4A) HIT family hydrolase
MTIDFSAYDDNNVFARIIRGELPSKKLYEDEHVLAFHDIAPQAPVHVLVVPKGRYIAQSDFHENAGEAEIAAFWRAVARICRELEVAERGHRLIANEGSDSGQLVAHFHVHILAGRRLGRLVAEDS